MSTSDSISISGVAVQPIIVDAPAKPVAPIRGVDSGNSGAASRDRAPDQPLSPEALKGVVKELNDAMKIINTALSFTLDKPTGKMVIKVTDENTKQVIRQIPSEEMMRVAERITKLLGILYDKKQ